MHSQLFRGRGQHASAGGERRASRHSFERKLRRTIPLEEIKRHADALGEGFPLVARGNRLSVMPVTAAQWKLLLSLE